MTISSKHIEYYQQDHFLLFYLFFFPYYIYSNLICTIIMWSGPLFSTLCILGNVSCFCCRLLAFFKISFFKKKSGTLSECQTIWTQIRTDIMSVLIWVQTICKGYQRTTKVVASKERAQQLDKNYSVSPLTSSLEFLVVPLWEPE